MDPVLAGMCQMESAVDGTLTLRHFAVMNDALEARRENERRSRKANEPK